MGSLTYGERLTKLKLDTLELRRLHFNLLFVYIKSCTALLMLAKIFLNLHQ